MMLFSLNVSAEAVKPSGGATGADLVISKVFYNNMLNDDDKAYILANYIELYNNSDKQLNITGVYIGLSDNTSSTAAQYVKAWTAANMLTHHPDSIALLQIFQIPTDKTYTLDPGKSIVLCNSAINHTTVASKAPDLSGADFEAKSEHTAYKDNHNDNVAALNLVFTYNAPATYILWKSPGPFGVVLLQADTDISACPTGDYMGDTENARYKFVPGAKTIDAVDFVEHSAKTVPDASQKRIPDSYDKGFIATDYAGGNGGEALVRKKASETADKRIILCDTNNSSDDFEVTTNLAIRQFDFTGPTAIRTIEQAPTTVSDAYYTLSGQRTDAPTQGIYIHNGKKVVIQ